MKRDETRKGYTLIGVLGITVLAFLIFFSSMASAATAQSGSPTITESQISYSGTAAGPTIYDNKIVWSDWRNGQDNCDIYMYDLSTSKETRITISGSAYSPDIYSNRIVWTDWHNGQSNPSICMYDLSTFQETQISHSGESIQPRIYDNRIVWEEYLNNKRDIYMYDLSTSQEIQISLNASAYNPAIYGNKIVWDWNPIGTDDIYMYDLSTSKETQISHSGTAAVPAIYGNRVVWLDYRNGWDKPDIYMYDLSTSKETQISHSGYAGNPEIYGNRIVWTDNRNGEQNYDIYMYDLSTSQETQITTNDSMQSSPAIYGDMIVWEDYRNGQNNPDIYMCTISEREPEPILPVANFSTNVTNGYVPLSVEFTDLSQNTTSRNWGFGDGDTSTEQNPMHTYSTAGTYTVNLTVSNTNGTNSKTTTINVLKATPTITWNNPADIISGTALSNTQLSASASVPGTFVYTPAAGTVLDVGTQILHVDFTPTDTANYTTASKDVTINVSEKPAIPVADFSASPTTGKAPLTVTFTDKSIGSPTSWFWNFGDKSISTDPNPVHQYNKAGKYTVSLTVKNAVGNNTKKISNYITVKNK